VQEWDGGWEAGAGRGGEEELEGSKGMVVVVDGPTPLKVIPSFPSLRCLNPPYTPPTLSASRTTTLTHTPLPAAPTSPQASSGLLGSYLAATGYNREIGAAYCLTHWIASLPLAYSFGSAAAAAAGPAAAVAAMVRVHTAAWGVTAAVFGVGYSCAVARSIPRPDVLAAAGTTTADREVPRSNVAPGGVATAVAPAGGMGGSPGFVSPTRPGNDYSDASPVRDAHGGTAKGAREAPRSGRDSVGSARGGRAQLGVSPLREPLLPGPRGSGGSDRV
jgi:hypothetical protein